jgi:lipooligosaccharide transport system ATP-binding protein
MDESIISVHHVYKTYHSCRAVDDLSFNIPGSSCFGFLGPNGAGKTTMMKIIYGRCLRDSHPDTVVKVMGYDPLSHELEIKYLAGVVAQEDNLDTQLNVLQNLHVYSKFYGMREKEAAERIAYLLDFLEISDKRESMIRELSGGMKRRLIIARALLHAPRLLILDEPTTGLDPQVRHLIWEKLRRLKEQGLTILLTTHYMEEAFQLCNTILILDKGRKIMC